MNFGTKGCMYCEGECNKKCLTEKYKIKDAIMTKKQILKLRPEFYLTDGMRMTDWFEIIERDVFCTIRSGLRHSDGITKSPYYYEATYVGKNPTKHALKQFTDWWMSRNIQNL
jgi:hypothetical protein